MSVLRHMVAVLLCTDRVIKNVFFLVDGQCSLFSQWMACVLYPLLRVKGKAMPLLLNLTVVKPPCQLSKYPSDSF